MVDLLVVNPSSRKQSYQELTELQAFEPPIWAALEAAHARKEGFSVKILDAELDGLTPIETSRQIFSHNPLLVCISVMGANPSASSTPKIMAVRDILRDLKLRDKHLPIVLEGIHPSALPERTLKEEMCDFVCRGEAFLTISDLLHAKNLADVRGLAYRDNGGNVKLNSHAPLVNPNDLPMPAWDLLPMERYRAHNWHSGFLSNRSPYSVIYSAFGCSFNCFFCNVKSQFNGKPGIRYRSPELVVDEITHMVEKYHVKYFKFLDELFVLNKAHVLKICDGLIERNLNINAWAYARIDTANREMLTKMKQAGIKWVAYGIESAVEQVRSPVGKGYSQQKILDVVRMTQELGIGIVQNFIFGLPEDNLETMQENLAMAEKFNCEYANLYCSTAYPGSDLYTRALKEEWSLPSEWSGYGQYAYDFMPLPTKHLSPTQVLKFRDEAFKHYFSRPEYQDMMRRKYGDESVRQIQKVLEIKLKRRLLGD